MRKLGGQSNPLMQYVLAFFVAMSAMGIALVTWSGADETSPRVRKKPWGTDHVGERYPEYVTGDECLFCHRTIGPLWDDNRHQLTIRRVRDNDPALKRLRDLRETEALAAEVQYLMGTQSNVRFLKRAKAYGKLDLLSTSHDNDKQAHCNGPPTFVVNRMTVRLGLTAARRRRNNVVTGMIFGNLDDNVG